MTDWEKELTAAGWKRVVSYVWKAPNGALVRGPYAAWQMMKSCEQWGGEPVSTVTVITIGRRKLMEIEAGK